MFYENVERNKETRDVFFLFRRRHAELAQLWRN